MSDLDPTRGTPEHLRCAGCRYDLMGLDPAAQCPECGLPIATSIKQHEEFWAPIKKIPHLKRTLALLVIATLTGAPALILYSTQDNILVNTLTSVLTIRFIAWRALNLAPWLLVIGSFMPLFTILSIPTGFATTFRKQRSVILITLLLLASTSAVLFAYGPVLTGLGILQPQARPPWMKQSWMELFVAAPIAACACALGLSTAAKLIGQTVPTWKRLGSARQTAAPLIGAILVIAVLRPAVLASALEGGVLFGAKTILIGAELLLVIGALYLLVNRIWLVSRLGRALRLARMQKDRP